ncbi:hypothetical protein ACHAQJ_004219 [Trichoderma viride]
MFTDVTIGDQSSNGFCLGKGFSAVPGWDPVSGLGTPQVRGYAEVLVGPYLDVAESEPDEREQR